MMRKLLPATLCLLLTTAQAQNRTETTFTYTTTAQRQNFQKHWQLSDQELARYEEVMINEGRFRYPKLTPVEILAITAKDDETMRYYAKKAAADEMRAVRAQLATDIVRPSVVYGRGGKSCELFIRLARLPLLVLPEGGRQMLQPVHVYDVADGVAALLAASSRNATINMSGGRALSLAAYLNTLRATLHGKTAARVLPLPSPLLAPFLPLTNYLSDGMVSAATLRLLADGSCADNRDFTALLGRAPLAPEQFAAADVAGF